MCEKKEMETAICGRLTLSPNHVFNSKPGIFFPSNSLFLCMLEFQMLSFTDLLSGSDCFNSLLNPKLDHSDLHFLCLIFVLLALDNCISFLQKFYCIPRNICNIFLLGFYFYFYFFVQRAPYEIFLENQNHLEQYKYT